MEPIDSKGLTHPLFDLTTPSKSPSKPRPQIRLVLRLHLDQHFAPISHPYGIILDVSKPLEISLEITSASLLWDDIPTNKIPPEYVVYAAFGCLALHYLATDIITRTVLKLWLAGVPIVLDGG